ncbi:MAG: hypothetical protein HGGPFJEG_00186 [Ignavibacteria bacterium]|nr:hypothetical protein [Ignavibacteria bacterium]
MIENIHLLSVSNTEGFLTEIKSRNHKLTADEPIESGGTDKGVDAYELLLASLGTCKAITMRMYANRKNFPLKDVKINLKHYKINAADCDGCKTKEGKIDKIDIEVEITGDLSEAQKARILEIGEKCPVQRTILSEVIINTTSKI